MRYERERAVQVTRARAETNADLVRATHINLGYVWTVMVCLCLKVEPLTAVRIVRSGNKDFFYRSVFSPALRQCFSF